MNPRIPAYLLVFSFAVLPACSSLSHQGTTPPSPPKLMGSLTFRDCFPIVPMEPAPDGIWSTQGTRLLGIAFHDPHWDVKNEFALPAEGAALAGARVHGRLQCAGSDDKLQTDARIVAALPDTASGGWLYDVEILAGENGWTPVCTARDGTKMHAVALPGAWDDKGNYRATPGSFSFACTTAVAAKCARAWHYAPGSELHAACTRMARADYCGKGKPHTFDGTHVGVWSTEASSSQAPQEKSPAARAHFEAAWTSRGAVCLDHPRFSDDSPECDLPRCTSAEDAQAQAGAGRAQLLFSASCTPDPRDCAAANR